MDAQRIETRQAIQHLYVRGQLDDAADRMSALIRSHPDAPSIDEYKLLSLFHYAKRDYRHAIESLRQTHLLFPDDVDTAQNIGRLLLATGRATEALVWLERVHRVRPDTPSIHDGLAEVYGRLGNQVRARYHGERSLTLKDGLAAERTPICAMPDTPPPPFRQDHPRRNVIAFSLWGNQARYINGAIRNAELARQVYPGWRCRFYCGRSVPGPAVAALLAAKAEVIIREQTGAFLEGLFWRFDVASDPTVDRFLVRDADSVIGPREAAAVADWLRAPKPFHLIRDYFTHTDLMLAGLWGGSGGILPDLTPHYAPYLQNTAKTFNSDQQFLGAVVWPAIRNHALVHDSCFRANGSHPFPADAPVTPGRHVGQNASVHATPRG
jgi:tetratricopeptide (TPR) repeat protein